MRGTRSPRLLGIRDYLNNYVAYKPLTGFRKHAEFEASAYMGLRII